MKKLNSYLNNYNPYSNVYGFARSLLALSSLLVLLFNDTTTLLTFTRFNITCDFVTVPTAFCVSNENGIPLEVVRYIFIIILAIIASGWRPRFTGIIHWYIAYSLQSTALTLDGGEQINTVLTFLLIPLTLLDGRKNHFYVLKRNPDLLYTKYISFLFMMTVKFQVFLIYANAAVQRLKNPEWADGTALYYFFTDPVFGLPDYQLSILEPILNSQLIIPITWSVTVFELFLAACIITSFKFKKIGLYLGILFHVGIMLTLGLITFGTVMIAALVLYLVPFNYTLSFVKPYKYIRDFLLANFKKRSEKNLSSDGKKVSDL